ncbi:MAG: polysaccharide biosynthesis protein [Lachnospiraceae bacterium]|nr:polysaccharide biosynthesis protein [Lachnospiraceae bacterium]
MKETRIKNTSRNIVSGIALKLSSVLFPFIVNTIIIKTLGVEYLGLSSLFASIFSVLSLTELGFGTAMVFSMYEPVAKNEFAKASALLSMYKKVYVIIGIVILGGGMLCIPILPLVIEGDVPDSINIYLLFLICLTNTVISYFLFAYRSAIFMANQRKDIVDKINIVIEIGLNLSKILVLLITKNYYLFCALQPIYTVINSLLTLYISKKMYPEYKCYGNVSKAERKSIFSRVFGLSIHKICNVISNSFDSVIISSFLGLTILGQYYNYFVIGNAIMLFMDNVTASATSSIGNSMVCESVKKNYEDFKTIQFGYNIILGWASVCMLCLIQPFIKIWLGEELLFDNSVAITISIYIYAIVSSSVFVAYRSAAGIWAHDKIRPFVEAGINLILNIILVRSIGVCGVMISTILTMGIMRTIWGSYYLFDEYFKEYSHLKYLATMLVCFLIVLVSGVITFSICNLINLDGIWELVARLGVCIVIPGVIFFVCFFRTVVFKRCIGLAKSIIKH